MSVARISAVIVCSALLAVTASPAFGAASRPDPGTTVYNAGGSNLGECSSYLGTQQLATTSTASSASTATSSSQA